MASFSPHHPGRLSSWVDRLGSIGAFACAVHCAFVPVAMAVLPFLGLGALASEGFDRAFLALATALGLSSLLHGYRAHRSAQALACLIPGLAAIAAGVLGERHQAPAMHAALMVCGGLMITLAHVINMRLFRRT